METERLIGMMAADRQTPASMSGTWTTAAAIAAVCAAAVFFAALGPRPDIAAAAGTLRFLFKFLVTIALFGTAFAALVVLARPGARMRPALPWLLLAPVLLFLAVMLELMNVPPDQFAARWLGTNAWLCMTFIPAIGILPLIAFLGALRHGAPTRPVLAGAMAGLVSGGLAATFYAAHCFDDSPFFVATWYSLAIAILAAIGAVAGRYVARW